MTKTTEYLIECATCFKPTPAEWVDSEYGGYWTLYFEYECQNCFEEWEVAEVTLTTLEVDDADLPFDMPVREAIDYSKEWEGFEPDVVFPISSEEEYELDLDSDAGKAFLSFFKD